MVLGSYHVGSEASRVRGKDCRDMAPFGFWLSHAFRPQVELRGFDVSSVAISAERNEEKHDGSGVTGMSDQEKELASSAYECFLVSPSLFGSSAEQVLVRVVEAGAG